MFKRVEKRRRKQEEEEELGLDDDMKEVLGINDTDSEESESDSDESESNAEDNAGDAAAEGEADGDEDDDDEDDEESSEDGEEPPISVQEALRDPVYIVSIQPDVKACIVCPGKLIKSAEAHERRWRQFTAFAKSSSAAPDSNAWDVLKLKSEQQPKLSLTPSTVSKRTEKREQMAARREKKRAAKIKAKAKAKASGEEPSPKPLKKKRKVEDAPAPAAQSDVPESTPGKPLKALKARSPRTDRLERQGKLVAKLAPHEPPGGRGKGNGKKKGPGGRGKQGDTGKGHDERGKRSRKDSKANEKSKPLQIFD
ncbi:hypothetical protein C8R44DRAFT_830370 [Mycena epipterygia]|nr:hypothetical protein C8R44DRAFT_830370 [Mycena epipterygia]